jgi:membrane peptidoglycan carboxypeptidase
VGPRGGSVEVQDGAGNIMSQMSPRRRRQPSDPDPSGNGPPPPETESTGEGIQGDSPSRFRRVRWLIWITPPLVGLVGFVAWEMRTSTLQAWYFTRVAEEAAWGVEPGPSPSIVFPEFGPTDQRLGYTEVPRMADSLRANGFDVVRQARVTDRFADVVSRGIFPPYVEKTQGGLTLLDRRGAVVHRSPSPARVYATFDSIPDLLWRTLLFIENRDFLDADRPRANPAVEWDRFLLAAGEMALSYLGSDRNVPGGSTIATQLEKFRHSPEGRTASGGDKIRQMLSASLRAYLDGPETLDNQRRIVRDYLNSVPLAAQIGHGEVVGTADGLWAWYGTPFEEANRLLEGEGLGPEERTRRAEVYRQALSLIVAHRRPSYFLVQQGGRQELEALTDAHIQLLESAGVIPSDLAEAAIRARTELLPRAPEPDPIPFVERKAANQIRVHLLSLLGIPRLYDLDRYDLRATTTLDMTWQEGIADLFQRLGDTTGVREAGFAEGRMLDRGDPSKVIYSFTLLETTPLGNVVRIQTDNYDGPLSLSQAGRLELGSTAKLRTLVTYLEVIAELHENMSGLSADSLRALAVDPRDVLTGWARDHLLAEPGADLPQLLDQAMDRRYSASPAERFVTGGGTQTFSNFDRTYDRSVLTVRRAFQQSVNLPSVRTMRDIVSYFMFRGPGATARILEDTTDPARMEYLARFADREGSEFIRQFHRKYRDVPSDSLLDALVRERRMTPLGIAWAFRTVVPDADVARFSSFVQTRTPDSDLTPEILEDLYTRADPAPWDLNDLGYLARIHPLELWLVGYLLDHPGAQLAEVLEASQEERQEVYEWLFRTRRRNAQDRRIRTMLELEAFERVHDAWRRVGYPFGNIVPSIGTAIGSSGDRPLALAELVGIVLNGGVRYPIVRVDSVKLAPDTPFETDLARGHGQGERVMRPEVAAVVRAAMIDVVENGTGRRARGTVSGVDGEPLVIGGKTGTGDNRFQVYGPGGNLIESRVVNRTATLVFFIGDRHFGVVTAYVPGEEAATFDFTSALPAQILRTVGAVLSPIDGPAQEDASSQGRRRE